MFKFKRKIKILVLFKKPKQVRINSKSVEWIVHFKLLVRGKMKSGEKIGICALCICKAYIIVHLVNCKSEQI